MLFPSAVFLTREARPSWKLHRLPCLNWPFQKVECQTSLQNTVEWVTATQHHFYELEGAAITVQITSAARSRTLSRKRISKILVSLQLFTQYHQMILVTFPPQLSPTRLCSVRCLYPYFGECQWMTI